MEILAFFHKRGAGSIPLRAINHFYIPQKTGSRSGPGKAPSPNKCTRMSPALSSFSVPVEWTCKITWAPFAFFCFRFLRAPACTGALTPWGGMGQLISCPAGSGEQRRWLHVRLLLDRCCAANARPGLPCRGLSPGSRFKTTHHKHCNKEVLLIRRGIGGHICRPNSPVLGLVGANWIWKPPEKDGAAVFSPPPATPFPLGRRREGERSSMAAGAWIT